MFNFRAEVLVTRQNFSLGSWEEVYAFVQFTVALAVACDNDQSPLGQIAY